MPFTIFCHNDSSDHALEFFEENNAEIKGDTDDWEASYEFDGKSKRKKKTITFTYERQWCSPPNWPQQLLGMQNFIGQFPLDPPRRELVMRLIRKFKYCVGIICEPEIEDGDDERLEVIHALARHIDGTIFAPGALFDANFLPFATADGEFDPGAVIPSVGETPDEDEDYSEEMPVSVPPPTAERVVRRLYVLLAVAARGLLDMNLKSGNEPAYNLEELHTWLQELDIEDEIEDSERDIIYTPAGGLSRQNILNSVWTLEGLVVLAWSLKLAEIPRYDELVETDDLLAKLSFLDVAASKRIIDRAELRAPEELHRYNEQVFALDWRMVDFRIRPEDCDYANVDFGYGKFDLSWATLQEGDLSLRGTPIATADPALVQTVSSAAMERHKASNWLQGDAHCYSDVVTNT